MANNLVPDRDVDEEEEAARKRLVRNPTDVGEARQPAATTTAAPPLPIVETRSGTIRPTPGGFYGGLEEQPLTWTTGRTMPTTAMPGQQPYNLGQSLGKEAQTLEERLGRQPQGWKQKVLHGLSTVGQALAPRIAENIPETRTAMRERLERTRERFGEEEARQGTIGYQGAEAAYKTGPQTDFTLAQAEQERAKTAQLGGWHRVVGDADKTEQYDPVTGKHQVLWHLGGEGGPEHFFDVGTAPPGFAPEQAPAARDTIPSISGLAQAQPTSPAAGVGAAARGLGTAYGAGTLAPTTPTAPPGTIQPTPPTAAPTWIPGAPPKQSIRLTEQERAQGNAEFAQLYGILNPGKPIPQENQLQPGANKDDYARVKEQIEAQIRAREAVTRQADVTQRAAETRAQKEREMAGEVMRVVDKDNKVHLLPRADYEAHKDQYTHAFKLNADAIKEATNHATALNEVQGRMNGVAEAAQRFDWNDPGQISLVQQALQNVETGWADKVIGIPITDWLRQNLTKMGLEGATPETRRYIIEALSLREASLAIPKEITGGSRMMETATQALWRTLPSGITPNREWALDQLRTAQGIVDRLKSTRVPDVPGTPVIEKIAPLYQHWGHNPKTGQLIYSDDNKNWVDEHGRKVE